MGAAGYGYDGMGYDGDGEEDDGAGMPYGSGSFAGPGMAGVAATMGEIDAGMLAKVVTNDAPPDGDLKVRSGPGASYPKIGGVDKGGVVSVHEIADDGDGRAWARISWVGGRLPATSGWVASWFLEAAPAEDPGPDPTMPAVFVPSGGGGVRPVNNTTGGEMSTAAKVGIGAGVLALGALAYYAFAKG